MTKKHVSKRQSQRFKLQPFWSTASITAMVAMLVFTGTFALLVSGQSILAAPKTAKSTCTVDPKQKKLQDQDNDETGDPWKRGGANQVTVYFAYGKVPPEYKADIITSAKRWSVSACIEAKAVKSCSGKKNCVPITFKRSGGNNVNGTTSVSIKGGYASSMKIDLNSKNTSNDAAAKAERMSTIAHEMGHGLGLAHRKKPNSVMSSSNHDEIAVPDKIDFQNLRVIYGSQK